MHSKTYPDFLTPRDENPSLSSSEEKSSENVWLARKWKWKKEGKTEQGSVYSIYLYIYIPLDYMILYYMILYYMISREQAPESYI